MAATIDELQIEIQASAAKASAGIDALIASLSGLKGATKGGAGLTTATKQFERFSAAVNAMQNPSAKVSALVSALKPLESIGKSNLGSTLNQLKKIPEITAGLDDAKLSAFAAKITQVTAAVRPLAAEMEKVSAGFSKLPANIQRAINANARLTSSNYKAQSSFFKLSAIMAKVYVIKRIANVIGGWIKESNDYVENLNLFTAAMGEYADSAKAYAEQVGDAMGIDPSEWMRNQGIFMTLLTGFGNAADRAALMSKNLTQLGYDLSSFFNISFADAMQKLQSGISGELEPLRRLGYDLSQAKLEAIALSLGIDRAVSSMTQAEKSQLRYYAIMTQVTTAQGDMARTLQAPANQLRILSAQATQAARALGNIFIPALNAILPYAIAFLKIVRMVAQSLATLFGFSMPEIDYSGLQSVTVGAEDAEDALGGAAGAAKKLKGMLAGFDEINVITQPNVSGGGGGGGGGGGIGGDLGIPLPDMGDWLGDAINKRVDDLVEGFKKWIPLIKGVGIALLAAFAAKKLLDGIGAIGGLKDLFLKGGLTGGIAKVTTGIIGFIAAAGIAGTAAYALTINGMNPLAAGVTAAAGAFALVGPVLYAMLGPVGLVVAAIGAIAGAIIGVKAAQDQLLAEKVSEWFYSYNEGSTTITELAAVYGAFCDEVIARKQPIIDGFNAFEDARDRVKDTSDELSTLLTKLEYSAENSPELIQQIKDAINSLYTETQTSLDLLYDNIIHSLADATGDAYEAMGGHLEDIYALLDMTFGAAEATMKNAQQNMNDLIAQFEAGDISESAFIQGMRANQEIIADLTQTSIPALNEFEIAAQTAFDGIDFEDPAAVSEALTLFKEKTQAAKDALIEAAGAEHGQVEAVRTMMESLGTLTPAAAAMLDDWDAAITEGLRLDTQAIDDQFAATTSIITTSLVSNMQRIAEDASAEWNSMSGTEQWASGFLNEADFVAGALREYKTGVVDEITKKLIEANGAIGSGIAAQTDSIFDDVMEALFAFSINGAGGYISGFKTDIESAFKGPLEEIGASVPDGVATGVNNNLAALSDAMEAAAWVTIDAFGNGIGYGSPAAEFIPLGASIPEGIALGIDNNKSLVTGSFKSLLNDMLDLMEQFTSKIATAMNTMLKNFSTSMSSMSVSGNGAVSYTRMSGVSISGFAEGGFPDPGELFYAREGGIPEMVGKMGGRTAVASNDQIVEAVSQGVYRAVSGAMGGQNGTGDVYVYIGGEQLDAHVVRAQSRTAVRSNGRA